MKHLITGLFFLISIALVFAPRIASAQDFKPNYDESKIPAYTLSDPLVMEDGTPVKDAKTWVKKRRPEILRMFENEMFGKVPGPLKTTKFVVKSEEKALDGKAIRKLISILPTGKDDAHRMDLLLYLPANHPKRVPVFVGLNFEGNHVVTNDPGIPLTQNWVPNNEGLGISDHKANEKGRGNQIKQWQVEKILARGYGFATMYYGDIDPDFDDGFQNGIQPLFYKPGQSKPVAYEWGSIGAWAWGLSRIMDYLKTDHDINSKQVAVFGHSRLGKTALWAGALDQRFALVISNNSGCGGAALSKRCIGETVWRINTSFPHWFCGNFKLYNNNESKLPFDQHELLALIAPRPLYVASAEEDQWADPKGEFLSAKYADPVYRLLGTDGLPASEIPKINQSVQGTIGYHIRSGKHDVTEYDWEQYLNFADKHFKGK